MHKENLEFYKDLENFEQKNLENFSSKILQDYKLLFYLLNVDKRSVIKTTQSDVKPGNFTLLLFALLVVAFTHDKGAKLLMLRTGKDLGHLISNHLSGGTIHHLDGSILNGLTDEVVAQIHMLGA